MIRAYRFFPQVLVLCAACSISFPLLSFVLVDMGASTQLVGIIAAMPAMGRLIGTPLIPAILRKMSLPALTLWLLCAAALAWAGFWLCLGRSEFAHLSLSPPKNHLTTSFDL